VPSRKTSISMIPSFIKGKRGEILFVINMKTAKTWINILTLKDHCCFIDENLVKKH
jgi:hypothetical protein